MADMRNSTPFDSEKPTTPLALSESLPLKSPLAREMGRFFDQAASQEEILKEGKVEWGEVQPVLELTLRVPPWLPADWMDFTAVVHVIVPREQREEVEFAEVLDVEDIDEAQRTVRIRLATMHPDTPLLKEFINANRTVVTGIVGMRRINNELRPVLGVMVQLSM